MYQVRIDGALTDHETLSEALLHADGKWEKVSWSVGKSSRMILYSDGTWEWRTPESIRKLAVVDR